MHNEKKIGIVIITYDRPAEMLALAKNIARQENVAEYLKEVIIVNNNSAKSYEELSLFVKSVPDIPFIYYDVDENLGVSRGRNWASKQATAPFLLYLDDDAEFQSEESLKKLNELINEIENSNIGAVSLKVLYYDTLQPQINAFPHKKFKHKFGLNQFETYYYTGLAHILKKEALEKAGFYPTDFFYGMEEYDLSYKILDLGYRIIYDNRVTVLHKESPLGRTTKKEKLQMMWVNKSKVAYRYLPKKYFYSTAILWSLFYIKNTSIDIKGWLQGWQKILKIASQEKRVPLSKTTLAYLRKTGARLEY